ncbi:MAG: phage major capsid protein [Patescibacteria group bacterium]|nr:phage major capsid protein [Patescibacteria group bacterium]MDE2015860.1 phage major capsid protein [Patescibacteria group bacterium]MDE2227349.1 phage major capsid protein [Patescibacteria group bacterium]
MAYDGIQNSNRVTGLTTRALYTKVVDQVLNSATYYSRLVSQGEPFEGSTMDVTYDVTADSGGQFFTGLETLNSSAVNTTATASFAHTAYTQPVVSIMLESFANVGSLGIINLDTFKYNKAAAQALQQLGSSIYSTGSGNQPLGLTAIVDDSTNVATIGGLARSTYTVLDSTLTAYASGKLTLATMGTQYDSAIASGMAEETPNVGVTTKGIFTLYEQLLTPNVRATYDEVGYDRVLVRSKFGQRGSAELKNASGFNALSYRDMHIMRDDQATAQMLWMVNEDYIHWHGRTEVPAEYEDVLEKVDFGTSEVYEGTGAMALDMPSEYNGWFYQKPLLIPDQAGRIARFYVIGQTIPLSFRRHSKGTGITGV